VWERDREEKEGQDMLSNPEEQIVSGLAELEWRKLGRFAVFLL
jgi:hypothetical protein